MSLIHRWVIAALAVGILILGWQSWNGARRVEQIQRQLQEATQDQMLMANSAIFDANCALQQVQDPASSEAQAAIRRAAEDLIIARERLNALRLNAYRAGISYEDGGELADRVHAVAMGLQAASESREFEKVYGYRNFLRVMTEHLPFPNQRRDLAAFREGIAQIRTTVLEEGFTLSSIPSAPPTMQLVVAGTHSPVRRGGSCWSDRGPTRCVDMAGPAELVRDTTPPTVSPASTAELHFAWPPQPGSIKLWRLTEGRERESVSLGQNLTFALPKESGTYIYWAEANWESGNGTYAFKVNIK